MPLYGSQLWDFNCSTAEVFYTAWRKSIRYLFNLPTRTHSVLLPNICEDIPINEQISNRLLKFYKSLCDTPNTITNLCASVALHNSMCPLCNSLIYLSSIYNCHKLELYNSRPKVYRLYMHKKHVLLHSTK